MISNATVWQVFQVMSHHITPFSVLADLHKKAYSEGVFVFNMTWENWSRFRRAPKDLWRARPQSTLMLSVGLDEVFPPRGQAAADFGGDKGMAKVQLKKLSKKINKK